MTFHTYLTHTNPYQSIIVKDRHNLYYVGDAGLCFEKSLWDREILKIKKGRTDEVVQLRVRRKRSIYG